MDVAGREIRISNPDKLLYPAAGFTKAQVIDYYVRAAPWMLPHLRGRPVTLKRFPNGVGGEFFYEKDAPGFTPEWVRTFPVPRRTGESDIRYIVIDDLPTLVWCANLASLELHPFLHRAPEIGRPTAVVFDLDPGEGADILTCARIALLLRDTLTGLGLNSFAKVSGSKGIQVYVPLNATATYAATQGFARGIAEMLEREHPRLVVSEMAKAMRKGKVFIDWSQNADFKTTVGVYSLRAKRPEPFISMPIKWEELEKPDRNALYFGPEAAITRLERSGDLFAPVLEMRQALPVNAADQRKPARPRARPAAGRRRSRQGSGWVEPALEFVPPMLAASAAALPESPAWHYEVKFDGYRTLAARTAAGVTLYSRRGHIVNDRFPAVADALRRLPAGTMVDGEAVALDKTGRPSFNVLQNYEPGQPLLYYVFDVLYARGISVMDEPLQARREALAEAVRGLPEPVRLSEILEADAHELIAAVRKHGLEGIVAKRRDSRYEPGKRSGAWVKYKVNQGQELVIGGYMPGRQRFDSLLVGYYESGRLLFIGKVKNGFVPAMKEQLYRLFQPLETDRCPFANLPEPANARRGEALTAEVMKKCRWLRPELVAQIGFTEWTPGNHLRHSRFVGLRDDKDAREVTREAA